MEVANNTSSLVLDLLANQLELFRQFGFDACLEKQEVAPIAGDDEDLGFHGEHQPEWSTTEGEEFLALPNISKYLMDITMGRKSSSRHPSSDGDLSSDLQPCLPKRKRVRFSEKLEFKQFFTQNESERQFAVQNSHGRLTGSINSVQDSITQLQRPIREPSSLVACFPQGCLKPKTSPKEAAVWSGGRYLRQKKHSCFSKLLHGVSQHFRREKCMQPAFKRTIFLRSREMHGDTEKSRNSYDLSLAFAFPQNQMESVYIASEQDIDEGYVEDTYEPFTCDTKEWEGYEKPSGARPLFSNMCNFDALGIYETIGKSEFDGKLDMFSDPHFDKSTQSTDNGRSECVPISPAIPVLTSVYLNTFGRHYEVYRKPSRLHCEQSIPASQKNDLYLKQSVPSVYLRRVNRSRPNNSDYEQSSDNEKIHYRRITSPEKRILSSLQKLNLPAWAKSIVYAPSKETAPDDEGKHLPSPTTEDVRLNIKHNILKEGLVRSYLPRFPRYVTRKDLQDLETVQEDEIYERHLHPKFA